MEGDAVEKVLNEGEVVLFLLRLGGHVDQFASHDRVGGNGNI